MLILQKLGGLTTPPLPNTPLATALVVMAVWLALFCLDTGICYTFYTLSFEFYILADRATGLHFNLKRCRLFLLYLFLIF
jgi:hypothetical protein